MSQKSLTQRILFIILISSILLAACAPATPTILSGNPGTHPTATPVPLPTIGVVDVELIVSSYCGGEVSAVNVDYESANGKASVKYACSKSTNYQLMSTIQQFVIAYCGASDNEIEISIYPSGASSKTLYKVDCKITATRDEYAKLVTHLEQVEKDLKSANEEVARLKTRVDDDEKQLAVLKATTIIGTSTITSTVPITSTNTITTTAPITSTVPVTTTVAVGVNAVVNANSGALCLSGSVPSGTDATTMVIGTGLELNHPVVVTVADPTGKFVKIASSTIPQKECWVDSTYLTVVQLPQKSGTSSTLSQALTPDGSQALQLSKFESYPGNLHEITITGFGSDNEWTLVQVETKTTRLVKPNTTILIQYDFQCEKDKSNTPRVISISTLKAGKITGNTTRNVYPCPKTP